MLIINTAEATIADEQAEDRFGTSFTLWFSAAFTIV